MGANDNRDVTSLGPHADESVRSHFVHRHDHAQPFAVEAARLLADRHLEDILVFDVRGLSQVTDYIVIASGSSDRQIRAVGHELEELGFAHDMQRYGQDADDHANWLVIDFVDVVVHLFEPATRAHYDLEMMWDDAPRIPWRRPTSSP